MKKITLISMIVVILLMIGITGNAFAVESNNEIADHINLRRFLNMGVVIEIDADQLTIEKRDGGNYTYLVDEHTTFKIRNVENPDYSNVTIGDRVIILGGKRGDNLKAMVVGILPDDFRLTQWFDVHFWGEVKDNEVNEKTITVITKQGKEIPIQVDQNTLFFGQASALEELEKGWEIGVAGKAQEDDPMLSKVVIAAEHLRLLKRTGIITTVDLDSGNLEIMTRQGEEMVFSVDEHTKFHSLDNQISSIMDIETDMVVKLVARNVGVGNYLATHLAIANQEDLPNFDIKIAGYVSSVEFDSFIIETRDGEFITFRVDDTTKYRSRGVEIQNFEDLEPGLILLVGGDIETDGKNVAKLIIAIKTVSN